MRGKLKKGYTIRLCSGCGRDVATPIKPPCICLCKECGGCRRKASNGRRKR